MTRILLASSSPRRKEILQEMNIDFEAVDHSVNEEECLQNHLKNYLKNYLKNKQSEFRYRDIPLFLSLEKARSVAKSYRDSLVLGVDTLVFVGEEILSKPSDRFTASVFLKKLSGRSHWVRTGLSFLNLNKRFQYITQVATLLSLRSLSDEEIGDYLDREEVLNSSGGYKVQSFLPYVSSIEGSFYNVMGLPVTEVYRGFVQYQKFINI